MKTMLKYRADTDSCYDLEPGEFCYRIGNNGSPKWLYFWPVDSQCPLAASIFPQRNEIGATWRLSGTLEKPTLKPSVDAKGVWHGFVTDGEAAQ